MVGPGGFVSTPLAQPFDSFGQRRCKEESRLSPPPREEMKSNTANLPCWSRRRSGPPKCMAPCNWLLVNSIKFRQSRIKGEACCCWARDLVIFLANSSGQMVRTL